MYRTKDLVNKYLRKLKRDGNLANRTLISYESDLLSFANSIGSDKDIYKVTDTTLERYFSSLEFSNRLCNSSVARRASSIRGFFQYLEQEKIIVRSPITHIPLKIISKNAAPVPMTAENARQFFKEISKEFKKLQKSLKLRRDRGDSGQLIEHQIFCNIRNHLMFKLILKTGLKPGELTQLKYENVKISKNHATIITNREDDQRIMINDQDMLKLIQEYNYKKRQMHYVSPYFFFNKNMGALSTVMIQKYFKSYAKKSGIDKELTPSSLRHAFAINLIDNNTDLDSLRRALGYKTFEGLLIYNSYFKSRNRTGRTVKGRRKSR